MMRNTWLRLLALLLSFAMVAAACGDDEEEPAATGTEEPADGDAEEPADGDAEEPADGDAEEGAGGVSLAGICPDPLVIQTDWFPEAEHGAMYQLIGEGYTVDTELLAVNGPMVLGGQDLGINWEVRTGGPAIGFQPVSTVMYTDDSIHLGYATTDGQVAQFSSAPLLSVVAPLEQNPQIIMWDPETYPDVETLADLGEAGVTINVFAGGTFSEVFVAQGIWSADQIDPSYDGSPARFISEGGAIAQQGFASAEPFTYENEFPEWGKPVAFQTLHDAGFQVYSQTVAVRAGELEELRPCLEQVVPVIQQAVVDYRVDPSAANAVIIDAVEQFDTFWLFIANNVGSGNNILSFFLL
ncbi:MAG: hypothetical protein ACE367_03645, partial [Acidimicrobiales bacterium]